MRWMATIITLLVMSVGQSAFALYSNEAFSLSGTKSVSVALADDAKDGCWTNLRETREYAEEKLRLKGANIVPQPGMGEHDYELQVSVNAFRTRSGCVASIELELRSMTAFKNLKGEFIAHFAVVGRSYKLYSGYDKMNNDVLNQVKEFIDILK